jgi:hypothetical protein
VCFFGICSIACSPSVATLRKLSSVQAYTCTRTFLALPFSLSHFPSLP